MRCFLAAVAVAITLVASGPVWAGSAAAIISVPTAQQHGMARPWFAQVQLDAGRGRVSHMALHDGVLYVQTDQATITALDAETGHQLWSKRVGRPEHPSLTPAFNDELLATINGSQLYVCNRRTGEILLDFPVDGGTPSTGPTLSDKFVYVPLFNGRLLAYRLRPWTDPSKKQSDAQKEVEVETREAREAYHQLPRLSQEPIAPLNCQAEGTRCRRCGDHADA